MLLVEQGIMQLASRRPQRHRSVPTNVQLINPVPGLPELLDNMLVDLRPTQARRP